MTSVGHSPQRILTSAFFILACFLLTRIGAFIAPDFAWSLAVINAGGVSMCVLACLIALAGWWFGGRTAQAGRSPGAQGRLIGLPLLIVVAAPAMLFPLENLIIGGGNLRLASVAQSGLVISRYYELLGGHAVAALTSLLTAVKELTPESAGGWALPISAYLALVTVSLAAWGIVHLVKPKAQYPLAFLALILAPALPLLWGYVGSEPFVVAGAYLLTHLLYRLHTRRGIASHVLLWGVAAALFLFYLPTIIFLPALIAGTLVGRDKQTHRVGLSVTIALVSLALLVAGTYWFASHNLELSAHLLFLNGRNPHSDYGLFSQRHLGDLTQIILLGAPTLLLLGTRPVRTFIRTHAIGAAMGIMAGGALLALLVIDPVHSIVFDFPRYFAYLTPCYLLLILAHLHAQKNSAGSSTSPITIAAVTIASLLTWYPAAYSLKRSEAYAVPYIERHSAWYRPAAIAYRDAYFAQGEITRANEWEHNLVVRSTDYINLVGCRDLALAGDFDEAISELTKLKINHAYWTEPRYVLAGVYLGQRQYDRARAELDTLLMLKPFEKEYLVASYGWHRSKGAFAEALAESRRALKLYPKDSSIASDYMLLLIRQGDFPRADSLRRALMAEHPRLAFPYLAEGMMAVSRGDLVTAQRAYEAFISLSPDTDPDLPRIRKVLSEIVMKRREAAASDTIQ